MDWLGGADWRKMLLPETPVLEDDMRRELLTEEELRSQLRLQGVTDVSEVEIAYMEPDGR